mmetsp:Transcript_34318/g.25390  ORF Transcript_34318/g.25390 Transcript_34318/m.25390 type:complete len:80 (+) Transcript_34318:1491-1730(+)
MGIASLLPGDSIKYSQTKYLYVVVSKHKSQHPFPQFKLSQKFVLTITEIDVDSQEEQGSYEDDYTLDDVHLLIRDYIGG